MNESTTETQKLQKFMVRDRVLHRVVREFNDVNALRPNGTQIDIKTLTSAARAHAVSEPRQVAMYLLRKHGFSLPRIGKIFGGRDHTTVSHGVSRVTERMSTDDTFANLVLKIEKSALGS